MDSQSIIKAKIISKLEKLVKIELSYSEKSNEIISIKITGDFFLHPEETIEKLEDNLVGVKLEKMVLVNNLDTILKDSQFYGFNAQSLVDTILECCKKR